MRPLLTLICVAALWPGLRSAQQEAGAAQARFDPPSVVSAAQAIYPLDSVASGTVVLEVSLDETGKITGVRVVQGIPSLTVEAQRSIRKWRFRPARLNGENVPSKFSAAFTFVPPNVGPRVK